MTWKTRNELREIENKIMEFQKKYNNELLNYERERINQAMIELVCADTHIFHLGISHKKAKYEEIKEELKNDEWLPF